MAHVEITEMDEREQTDHEEIADTRHGADGGN